MNMKEGKMGDLQNFFNNINSLYWWISVFLVGIVISVIGNVLYKFFDKIGTKYIISYRIYSTKKKLKMLEEDIAFRMNLMKSPTHLSLYIVRVEAFMIKGLLYIITGVLFGYGIGWTIHIRL